MNNHRVIAVCGKGGVGKTAFTTLLTKVMIEDPQAGKLLVVDADPALGLHYAPRPQRNQDDRYGA